MAFINGRKVGENEPTGPFQVIVPAGILKQVGFSIETAAPFVASVEIRADLLNGQSRNVNWDVKQDSSPWRQMVNRTIAVTNQWQRFTMPFTANFAMENIGRVGLSVENVPAPVNGCFSSTCDRLV